VVEGEVVPSKVLLSGANVKRSAGLLGVKKFPIDEDLPTIPLRHRVKDLPAFKRSVQIEFRKPQLHKILAAIHLLIDFTRVDQARADPYPTATPGKEGRFLRVPRISLQTTTR